MPTAPDDEALQRICEEVDCEISAGDLASVSSIRANNYAKAVARRYAATVGERKIERAFKDGYEDGAAGFIGDEDDAEEMALAQQQAWDRYAAS